MKTAATNLAAKLVLILAALGAVSAGQNVPTCTVSTDTVTPSCTGTLWSPVITSCEHRTITCPTVNDVQIEPLGITFGYGTPPTDHGTVVFFSYEGGTSPSNVNADEATYATYYYGKNLQVVQTAWDSGSGTDTDSDWEDVGYSNNKNVAYAAGRAAAFLNWVRYGSSTGGPAIYGGGGMCAQGNSGGGGEIAYYLAWYGGYATLDHAIFLSSPPLSNIDVGCATNYYPFNPDITVCPTGQLGCGNTAPWSSPEIYSDAIGLMQQASDNADNGPTGVCQGYPAITSSTANSEWQAMSIVDGDVATYNYPQTSMSAWLCSSVYDPSDGQNDGVMNNSSGQAQLFFQNFTSTTQYLSLSINGVSGCVQTENVTDANGDPAFDAIKHDMVNSCVANH
jgi:hypothetical protein